MTEIEHVVLVSWWGKEGKKILCWVRVEALTLRKKLLVWYQSFQELPL